MKKVIYPLVCMPFVAYAALFIDHIVPEFSPHVGESTVVQIIGEFLDKTEFHWQGDDGSSGDSKHSRFNVTPLVETDATVTYTVTAQKANQTITHSFDLEVLPARTGQLVLDDSVLVGQTGAFKRYRLSGHVIDLDPVDTAKLYTCNYKTFYYCTDQGRVGSDGTFSVETVVTDHARITVMLADAALDVIGVGSSLCPNRFCSGVRDEYTMTRVYIPFALDGQQVYDFANFYLLDQTTHANPQIANLLNRFDSHAVPGSESPAHFVRSYYDSKVNYLYGQTLAIMALSHAGEQQAAQTILNALQNTQKTNGAWGFSNYGDELYSGANAYVVMAINAYHLAFDDDKYDAMARAALDWLAGHRATVTVNGIHSSPIAMSDRDIPATPFDERFIYSLEHNLDAYSAFLHFGRITQDQHLIQIAEELRQFIESLWDPEQQKFIAGYNAAADQLDHRGWYLDNQSWSLLALGNRSADGLIDYRPGLAFNCQHFFESAGYVQGQVDNIIGFFDARLGPSNSQQDPVDPEHRFVWPEGTAGQILAMRQAKGKHRTCQGHTADDFLTALKTLSNPDGGIVHTTQTDDSDFSRSSSVSGTAWLYLAEVNFNPYQPSDHCLRGNGNSKPGRFCSH